MNGYGITDFGHLNFNDISNLKLKNMVSGIPDIHIPEKHVKNVFKKSNTRIDSTRMQEASRKPLST